MSRWLSMAKPKRSRRATIPGERLLDALAKTSFATMAILHRVAAENDLSLTQLRVAGILRDRRLRMAELAGYLGLEKSTMTGLVERAEARGIMARASGQDDGRVIDVFLTSEGLKLAAHVERQIQEALAPLTDRLEAADQRRLQELLERLLVEPGADDARGIVRTRTVATPPSRVRSRAQREWFIKRAAPCGMSSCWLVTAQSKPRKGISMAIAMRRDG